MLEINKILLILYIVIVSGISPLFAQTGWVDDGTVVRLETSTDKVGIGTTTPQGKLSISQSNFPLSESIRFDWGGGSPEYHSILTQFDANAITGNVMRFNLNNGPAAGNQSTPLELLGNGDINVGGSAIFKGPYPWIDVRAYGAKGDGITNDTAAIQAAINALPGGGGIVFLPPGIYIITSSLSLGSQRIQLIGAGADTTVIRAGANIASGAIRNTLGTVMYGVVLKDFTYDGAKATYTSGSHGIDLTGCVAAIVDRVGVQNCVGSGIFADGVVLDSSSIRLFTIRVAANGQDGVNLSSVWGAQVMSCYSLQNGRAGFSMSGGESEIIDWQADQDVGCGFLLQAADRVRLIGCVVSDSLSSLSGFGFDIRGSNHVSLVGCRVLSINIGGGNYNAGGVGLLGSNYISIVGCNIDDSLPQINVRTAIWLENGSSYCAITGNTLKVTNGRPIHEIGTSDYNLIQGNVFNTASTPAIVGTNTVRFNNVGDSDATIKRHLSATTTWDPPSISNGAAISTTVTVTGATVGDTVTVGFSQAVPGRALLVGAVTAANTVTVTLLNHTGASLNLASGTLRADVWKH